MWIDGRCGDLEVAEALSPAHEPGRGSWRSDVAEGGAGARLVGDGLIALVQRGSIAGPGSHTSKRPDHQQQLLPGHLPPAPARRHSQPHCAHRGPAARPAPQPTLGAGASWRRHPPQPTVLGPCGVSVTATHRRTYPRKNTRPLKRVAQMASSSSCAAFTAPPAAGSGVPAFPPPPPPSAAAVPAPPSSALTCGCSPSFSDANKACAASARALRNTEGVQPCQHDSELPGALYTMQRRGVRGSQDGRKRLPGTAGSCSAGMARSAPRQP